ncbi:MAG: aldo/keto reductase [Chitinophagales bacterium]
MRLRNLGKSGLMVSEIGFGCMSISGDEKDNIHLIHLAIDRGINIFDTADLYQHGANESMLGKALKGKRNQVILATKVGNEWRKDGSGWDWNPSKEYILKSVDLSLKRLNTDCIDLYQLHGGTMEDPIDDTIEAFESLRQKGKIRFYGISSIRPNLIREYVKRSGMVSVMMQYGLLDRRPEESSLQMLAESGIGILARGVLAKGLLAGKRSAPFLNYNESQVEELAKSARATSSTKRSMARTAIQWCLHNPVVSSAILGLRTREQLEDVLEMPGEIVLSGQEYQTLSGIIPPNLYDLHR